MGGLTEHTYVQWFPGHMTKTKRHLEKLFSQVDAVAEIVDARIPLSSRNPDLDKMLAGKPRIILLNKSDMADAQATAEWKKYFEDIGYSALAISCKDNSGIKSFLSTAKTVLADKIAAYISKGMVGRSIKIMVVGIPNVGKSTFINRMAGNSKIKTEDRPGVTRTEQWISLNNGIDLLDTPGVLWPKFDDKRVGEMLAFTGAVKDTVVDIEYLAVRLLEVLLEKYPEEVKKRYDIDIEYESFVFEVLERIALKRGYVVKGGEANTERAAIMLLDEFRGGKLGRITLERVGNK